MTTRLCSFAMLAAIAAPANAQTVVMPDHVIVGEPVPVVISGLPARQTITLVGERVISGDGKPAAYRAEARYVASKRGRVSLAIDAPIAGDYVGRDAAGLFWSMRPVAQAPADIAPDTIRITVSIAGKAVVSGVTQIVSGIPSIKTETVDSFSGATLFSPPSTRPLPVIIALGGSEGGSSFGRSVGPWLAGKGYAVLSLPYYAPGWVTEKLPGLPADFADIPVDRLEAVHRWIEGRTDLNADRIGLYGVSKGGEYAIIAASRFAWLKAVVAIVPSDVVWEGWGPNVATDDTRSSFSWQGKPLPYMPYKDMRETIAALSRGESRTLRMAHERGRAMHPERVAAATIPIDRFRGALLVAGGGKDETWPSADMARNIGLARAKANLPTKVLTFPEAGHGLSGSGWEPQNYLRPGSNPMATAHARATVRAATLHLFEKALR